MRMIRYSFLLLVILALSACETVVEVDLPEVEPKIVVFGFLNPYDEQISIDVRSSNPIFGSSESNNWMPLDDAHVVIVGPDTSIVIPFDLNSQAFTFSTDTFPINPGADYYIEVSSAGFVPVRAQTTVPSTAPAFSEMEVEYIQETQTDGNNIGFFRFDLNWMDAESGDNYYEISIQQLNMEIESATYTDIGRDQEMQTALIATSNGFYTGDGLDQFNIYLLHASEDYYRYKRSIKNITYGDPFSEPSLVYTNVMNGLGCFAAYNGTSQLLWN